jgi:hypothetical protein
VIVEGLPRHHRQLLSEEVLFPASVDETTFHPTRRRWIDNALNFDSKMGHAANPANDTGDKRRSSSRRSMLPRGLHPAMCTASELRAAGFVRFIAGLASVFVKGRFRAEKDEVLQMDRNVWRGDLQEFLLDRGRR